MKTINNDNSELLPRLVLIDDDPVFGHIFSKTADRQGLKIDCYETVLELDYMGLLGQYDVAVVDYDLGQVNGIEMVSYLSSLFGDIPMILVSSCDRVPTPEKPWSANVRCFVHKSQGVAAILQAAIEIVAKAAPPKSDAKFEATAAA